MLNAVKMLQKYIAGPTPRDVQRQVLHLTQVYGILPILDVVAEGWWKKDGGSKAARRSVEAYRACADLLPRHVYAIKLSCFAAHFEQAELLVAHLVHDRQCTVLIDAEDVDTERQMRPLAYALMQQHNASFKADAPRVFMTYQMVRRDMLDVLRRDMQWHSDLGIPLGIKLVRGGYMHLDKRKHPQLLFDTIQDTHAAYVQATEAILTHMQNHAANNEVVLATHNNAVLDWIKTRVPISLRPRVRVAQLLGMNDCQTMAMRDAGFATYKYVPYGTWIEAFPYLMRRLYENRSILKYLERPRIQLP
jgi:hypothetical protein